jgi:phage terminase Nu1 subunit (DNA packaging protein)
MDEIRVRYIRHLRGIAAGRAAAGGLDLATERARLAAAQAERVERANAVERGELTPTALLEQVLAKTATKVAGIFDSIPGLVRRRVPDFPTEGLDLIAAEVAKARNAVAAMSLSNLVEESAEEFVENPEAVAVIAEGQGAPVEPTEGGGALVDVVAAAAAQLAALSGDE